MAKQAMAIKHIIVVIAFLFIKKRKLAAIGRLRGKIFKIRRKEECFRNVMLRL